MTNEEREKHYKRKKTYQYLIIVLSFLVIVLESFALFKVISYVWGLIPFVLSCLVKYLNDKEINNNKKKIDNKTKK